jgi:hypothetical protein
LAVGILSIHERTRDPTYKSRGLAALESAAPFTSSEALPATPLSARPFSDQRQTTCLAKRPGLRSVSEDAAPFSHRLPLLLGKLPRHLPWTGAHPEWPGWTGHGNTPTHLVRRAGTAVETLGADRFRRRPTLMSHRLELGCSHPPRIAADEVRLGGVGFVARGSGPRQVVRVAARGSDARPALAVHKAGSYAARASSVRPEAARSQDQRQPPRALPRRARLLPLRLRLNE